MVQFAPSARLRESPFYRSALADGMVGASVYNSMILPTSYGDYDAEYWRLMNGVSQWDVGAERQVQLKGPDAARLAQILTVRDLSKCKIGQGRYAPICDSRGALINDPICLKLADDLFWFSIADSDIRLMADTVAAERGLEVEVTEPDVSPMALQGPKAEDVVAHVCGDWVRDLKYFWFAESEIQGIPVAVQRSGWSKQGGFEIYLRDHRFGDRLWQIFKEAGQPWDIGPGAPATAERIESGLVSVGGDSDLSTNPYEVRLGAYVDLHVPDDTIGVQALRKIHAEGPKRHQLGLVLEGDEPAHLGYNWPSIVKDGEPVGHMTNCLWSPRLKANVAYALVSTDCRAGDQVDVQRKGGAVAGQLCDIPFA